MLKATFALHIAKIQFFVHDNAMNLKSPDVGLPKKCISFISIIKTPSSCLKGHLLHLFLYVTGISFTYLYARSTISNNTTTTNFRTTMVYINSIVYDFGAASSIFVGIGALFLQASDAAIGETSLLQGMRQRLELRLERFGGDSGLVRGVDGREPKRQGRSFVKLVAGSI